MVRRKGPRRGRAWTKSQRAASVPVIKVAKRAVRAVNKIKKVRAVTLPVAQHVAHYKYLRARGRLFNIGQKLERSTLNTGRKALQASTRSGSSALVRSVPPPRILRVRHAAILAAAVAAAGGAYAFKRRRAAKVAAALGKTGTGSATAG